MPVTASKVAQRRARPAEDATVFIHGGLQVDLTILRVRVDGKEVSLTAAEYALLRLLVRHAGRVLTHSYMLREIWGLNAEEHRQYLRVYIAHLRRKIERNPQQPAHIITETGIGYRLISD